MILTLINFEQQYKYFDRIFNQQIYKSKQCINLSLYMLALNHSFEKMSLHCTNRSFANCYYCYIARLFEYVNTNFFTLQIDALLK